MVWHTLACFSDVQTLLLLLRKTPFVLCFRYERNSPVALIGDQLNPVAQMKYGFEWVNASATISVDLDLQDPNMAIFLELLYFTCVYHFFTYL